jgi:hypothetical protein
VKILSFKITGGNNKMMKEKQKVVNAHKKTKILKLLKVKMYNKQENPLCLQKAQMFQILNKSCQNLTQGK